MSRTIYKDSLEYLYLTTLATSLHDAIEKERLVLSSGLNQGERDASYISNAVDLLLERNGQYSQECIRNAQSIAFGVLSFYGYARARFDGRFNSLFLTQKGYEFFKENAAINIEAE